MSDAMQQTSDASASTTSPAPQAPAVTPSKVPVEESSTVKLVVKGENVESFTLGGYVISSEGTDVPKEKSNEIIAAALAAGATVEVVS